MTTPVGAAAPFGWTDCGWTLWVVVGLCLLAGPAAGQPLSRVTAHVSADSLKVGERLRLTLAAERAPGQTLHFPTRDAGPSVFGALTVLGRGPVRTQTLGPKRAVDSVTYTVTAFALDSVRVPALPVRAVAGADTSAVTSSPQTLRVVSVVGPNAATLRPGAPLAPFPGAWWPWLVGAAVLAVLAGGGGYWWWRRRPDAPAAPGSSAAASPYAAATARLRELRNYDLTDPSAAEAFYVELAAILRTYLSDRLGVAAPERTTREVCADVENRPDVPAEAADRLRAVLERADLVKFAGARPHPDAGGEALQAAHVVLDAIEEHAAADDPPPVDAVAGSALDATT